jgi:hypothetical protein
MILISTLWSLLPNGKNRFGHLVESRKIDLESTLLIYHFFSSLTQESRAKPQRKTKAKGNHLKNLSNRVAVKNEYEQTTTKTDSKTDKSIVL